MHAARPEGGDAARARGPRCLGVPPRHRAAVVVSARRRSTMAVNSSVTSRWNAPLAGLAKPAWTFLTRPSRPMKNVVGHELRLTACGTFSHISTGEPAIRYVYSTP